MYIELSSGLLKVIAVHKKTNAEVFKNLQVGDVIKMSIPVKPVGTRGSRSGTYAPNIAIRNMKTGEEGVKTFNQMKMLDNFDFEIVSTY
jgi:hypothetical protein